MTKLDGLTMEEALRRLRVLGEHIGVASSPHHPIIISHAAARIVVALMDGWLGIPLGTVYVAPFDRIPTYD